MPLPTIADVARVAVEGQMPQGRQWANVWHLKRNTGMSWSTFLADIVAPFTQAYSNGTGATLGWGHYQVTNGQALRLRVTPLDGITPTLIQPITCGTASTTAALPYNVAVVVTLRTPTRGRSFRGRIYLAAGSTSLDTTGQIAVSDGTAIAGIFSTMQTSLGASSIQVGVASYLHAVFNTVTSFTVDTKFDTQRRRNK